MRANRRKFMKIGGAAAAASAAAACKLLRPNTSNGLEVQIQGLCLIERKAGKVSVFFLDGGEIQGTMPSMSIKQHTPYLSGAGHRRSERDRGSDQRSVQERAQGGTVAEP